MSEQSDTPNMTIDQACAAIDKAIARIKELERELAAARAERAEWKRKYDACHSLFTIHNMGGMTDYNDGPVRRALAAEADRDRLAAENAALRNVGDGLVTWLYRMIIDAEDDECVEAKAVIAEWNAALALNEERKCCKHGNWPAECVTCLEEREGWQTDRDRLAAENAALKRADAHAYKLTAALCAVPTVTHFELIPREAVMKLVMRWRTNHDAALALNEERKG
jgi:hypothetical protein